MAEVDMQSGSDDSGMEDLDEEIEQIKKKVFSLQMKEEDQNISAANRLLDLLRRNGDFEELDDKRKQIVAWAPLSPNNWINWIKDVIEKEAPSVERMEEMFQKALFDENDVAIWIERIFFANKVSFEFCRSICEKALTAIGSRYDVGGHVWFIFLEYERENLKTSEYLNTGELKKRVDHVVGLYQRALRCATTQLEEVYQNAQQFCEETDQKHQLPELKKLFEATMRQKRQLDEIQKVIDVEETRKQGLHTFFEYEKRSGMPARVQMAHERMVSELDDDENVWSAYGTWTETVLKLPQVSVEVYERALRHCPTSFVLHQQALLAFERAKKPDEVIDRLWERAKQSFNDAVEGRSIYRTYAYVLRRRIVAQGSTDFSPMAEVFDEGAASMKEWFSMSWDKETEYREMQAYFYASLMHDMEKCRQIWNDILASGSGRFARKWIEVVRLERQFGDNENARKYLNKALNSVSDDINEIYRYYVQFEREEGSLAELDAVLEKVNAQVAHRAVRPQKKVIEKPAVQPKTAGVQQKRAVGGEPIVKKVKAEDGGFKAPFLPAPKKTPSPGSAPPSASASAPSTAPKAAPGTEDARTVFVSNLEFTTTEEDIRAAVDGIESIRFARKAHTDQSHRGFAYVVLTDEAAARKALEKDRVTVKGRPMFITVNDPEKRVGFKYATGLEKTKIFVRNVHFQATDDEISTLFSQFGAVTSVRRVTHRDGKPKGVAFVEFANEEAAEKCVGGTEKLVLHERELFVALSDPPKKTNEKKRSEEDGAARKGRLQMVPRALASRPPLAPPQITARLEAMDTSDASAPVKALSNDQFRQLFQKK
ncbi:unnamed protein product [Caenorhabditis sp. 36 PRJEB53466]|nr:unnamed protein product [Caenorhabditis sp. 36 PRJEB53466]